MSLDPATKTQLLDMVERFVKERLQPAEEQVERDDAIPADIVSDMRELGLFGLAIPTEYDGLGLTMEEEVEVAFLLGQTSPAFRSLIGTNNGIGSQGIILDGTEAQKTHWLPKMAAGEAVGSFALTEPDVGSDAASIRLTAERDSEDYILNGTKRYITNAPIADVFTVLARTNPEVKGAKGISAFLVPATLSGISIGKPDKKLGQRGTKTADVIFENCRVPAQSIIGGEAGKGFDTAMKVLNRGRLHIAAICVGAATRILNDALAYAMQRKQFGQPIAQFQLIQAFLADSRAELMAGRAMVLEAARKRDRGEKVNLDASCSKLFCSEMVGRVADRALQIHGGAGYMAEYAIERQFRDVRLFRIYEGTSQIQQLVIAREMIAAVDE
ncbi:acyl-CoA dehydrogenase family protein [Sulfitobacter dubius]|uniref:Acyl-CoA dehydrogenase n=1 Tax=Sulfitobacter dubius TaxID=218673 RepID=A0ABY3ZRE1_9RHOB|nr:acyl-CoA dehydrogenase family protein [Sulfitobacter dubius]UOA17195.1 Acyl-CoA dehydrogenase [Sulfitobacter dubius]